MPFIIDNNQHVESLLKSYQQCAESTRAMLRVLAVFTKPISQSHFKQLLDKLGNIDSLGKDYTDTLEQQLTDQELLDISDEGISLPPHLHHALTRACIDNGSLDEIITKSKQVMPLSCSSRWTAEGANDRVRQSRDHFYQGNYEQCEALFEFSQDPQHINESDSFPLVVFCFFPFERDFFLSISPTLQYQAFATLLLFLRTNNKDNTEVVTLLQSLADAGHCCTNMKLLLAEQYLLSADIDKAAPLLSQSESTPYSLSLLGWQAFLQQDFYAAIDLFERSKTAKSQPVYAKPPYVGGLPGIFYLLALLKTGYQDQPHLLDKVIEEAMNFEVGSNEFEYVTDSYDILENLAEVLQSKLSRVPVFGEQICDFKQDYYFQLAYILNALCIVYSGKKLPSQYVQNLSRYFENMKNVNIHWFAHLCASLLEHSGKADVLCSGYLQNWSLPSTDMVNLIKTKALWLQALDKLNAIRQNAGQQTADSQLDEKKTRMVWLMYPDEQPQRIEAREQQLGTKGWTKGRAVSLKQLKEEHELLAELSAEDHQLCEAIKSHYNHRYYGAGASYELSSYSALKACIGHPRIFLATDLSTPLNIVGSEPKLTLNAYPGGFKLQMPGLPEDLEQYAYNQYHTLTAESAHRYRLVNYSHKHLEIADIIGFDGLEMPANAKDQILDSIRAIAPYLTIVTDEVGEKA